MGWWWRVKPASKGSEGERGAGQGLPEAAPLGLQGPFLPPGLISSPHLSLLGEMLGFLALWHEWMSSVGEGPSWVMPSHCLSDSFPIAPAMHPLGDKHQSLFQHNLLGYILVCGLLFPSNPICLPCSRKSSSFLVDRGCPFLFSQGYLHLLLFLPVIFF